MLLEFISTKASDKPSPVQLKEETVEKNSREKTIHGDESTMGQVLKEETVAETKKEATKEFAEEVSKPLAPGEISIKTVTEKWPEILVDLKPHNHSLVAFLRACRPKEVVGETLVIEVFYKFHRDKLSEQRTREIFEQVVSNVFGVKIRAKFELSEKKPE
jgi:ribulose 1,5-bisphosphate carboxylase large subunit-like protein